MTQQEQQQQEEEEQEEEEGENVLSITYGFTVGKKKARSDPYRLCLPASLIRENPTHANRLIPEFQLPFPYVLFSMPKSG